MISLFLKGGPIMWPLLLASVTALTTVVERLIFILMEKKNKQPQVIEKMFLLIEGGEVETAIETGKKSRDGVARILTYGLQHRDESLSNALMRAANQELKRYNQGLQVLDTIITLAPLLGLLGTVTGMIAAFGLLGAKELSSPTAITGGIAEALIATAFGLSIAITALIPFNYLNARLEEARHDIEDSCTHLELLMQRIGVR